MTKNEFRFLDELKRLDDLQLGMIAPGHAVKNPEDTRARLLERGYIRIEGDSKILGWPILSLTTRGLRAWQSYLRARM